MKFLALPCLVNPSLSGCLRGNTMVKDWILETSVLNGETLDRYEYELEIKSYLGSSKLGFQKLNW